jgi:saccharopine dehydrogenase (NAD+, L-lysine-forming)
MKDLKLAVIREDKIPVDKRTPLTPAQLKEVENRFGISVAAQSSKVRKFTDEEYAQYGLAVKEDLKSYDILMGVKEVPIDKLIPDKTYFFFSHTIKEQPFNRDLLRAVLKKNIRLVDYECLTDPKTGQRLVAFGRYAGIVGAYNTIWTFGRRYNLFNLKRAKDCFDMDEMRAEYQKVKLPAIKIAVTGGGRVAKGAMEVLFGMGLTKVSPYEFIHERFDKPVFTQLNSHDYHRRKTDKGYERHEFHERPDLYESFFINYAKVADVLIACAFWDPHAPALFKEEDILRPDFKIRVIGDITCDIEGSIPSTKKASTIDDPIYDYNASDHQIEPALSVESNLTVMAVDNLPCELPRDASEDFGRELIEKVLPHLMTGDKESVIKNAIIAEDGKLTAPYKYLQNYVDGH